MLMQTAMFYNNVHIQYKYIMHVYTSGYNSHILQEKLHGLNVNLNNEQKRNIVRDNPLSRTMMEEELQLLRMQQLQLHEQHPQQQHQQQQHHHHHQQQHHQQQQQHHQHQ